MEECFNKFHDYVEEGIIYNNTGMYSLAIKSFNNAIKQNVQNPDLYNELGMAHFKQNNFKEAKKAFEKALSINKNSYKSYNNLAWISYYENDTNSAKDYFDKALKIAPVNKEIINNCGDFYFNLQNYDKALDYYLQSSGLEEDDETYLKIAQCYVEQSRFNDAITYLEHALALNDENPETYTELSKIYYKNKEMEKAFRTLQKLVELEPDNEWAFSNLGNIYCYYYENLEVAEEYYKKAYEINPIYTWAAYNLANIKLLYKIYDEALELYSRAYRLEPQNIIFINALGKMYYKLEDFKQSTEKFYETLSIDETNEEALEFLGKISLEHKKDLNSAKVFFAKAIKTNPHNSIFYYYLAKIYFFDFDKKNAMININLALSLNNEDDNYKALKNKICKELKDE